MAEAAQATATFTQSAEQGFTGTQKASDGLLGAISGGGHGRHLRLISMELGGLANAGQFASRETFALLGGLRALGEGMDGLSGPIGIAIAAVGALATGAIFLWSNTKKAKEELEKLEDVLVKEHIASMGKLGAAVSSSAESYGKLEDAYRKAGLAASANSAHMVEELTINKRIHDLDLERAKVLNAASVQSSLGHKKEAEELKALAVLMHNDIVSLRQTGETVDGYNQRMKKLYEDNASMRKSQDDANDRYAQNEIKRQEAIAKSYEQTGDRIGGALMAAARAHENFLGALKKDIINWAEDLMAKRVVTIALGFVLGGPAGIAALGAGGGILSSVSAFAGVKTANDTRMGEGK